MRDLGIPLPIGYVIQDFSVGALLGHGAFGITCREYDLTLHQTVAEIEYFPRECPASDTSQAIYGLGRHEDGNAFSWYLTRFLDEARLLGKLRHPNIVRIMRFFEFKGTAILVMDYCRGEPLDKLIQLQGRIFASTFIAIRSSLLDGFAHVHSAGVLHRDIKPADISLGADGFPILLDFGAAKVALSPQSKSVISLATAGHARFEQYPTKGKQGPRSDLYGVAAMAYRSLTGIKFQDSPDRMLAGTPVALGLLLEDDYSSQSFDYVRDRFLSFRPDERYQSIKEFRGLVAGDILSSSLCNDLG